MKASQTDEGLSRTQFDKPVDHINARVKKARKEHRDLEKKVKSLFPEGSRKSSFYLSIEDDFWAYRKSMKNLDSGVANLDGVRKRYAKLFSAGFLKSVAILREGDGNWEEALNLSLRLEDTVSSALKELDLVGMFRERFSSFVDRMVEVERFAEESESSAGREARAFRKVSGITEDLVRGCQEVDTTISRYPVYEAADSVRHLLEETVHALGAATDSLAALSSRLNTLLRGESRSGDERRVWDLYGEHVKRRNTLESDMLKAMESSGNLRQQLEQSMRIMAEFKTVLAEMDEAMARLVKDQKEREDEFEEDGSRFLALWRAAADGISMDDFPYGDLRAAFEASENRLGAARESIEHAWDLRNRFIEHAGKMVSPDQQQYGEFNRLKKKFAETTELTAEGQERYGSAADVYRNVIRENFVNTSPYWDLTYKVERKKPGGGGLILEENVGYIYDSNEYPDKPYHGKLIATYQLRLRKWMPDERARSIYHLIFQGSNEFGVEGMILSDGDSVLYRVSAGEVESDQVKTTGGPVSFVWELPVKESLVRQLARARRPILRVHLYTLVRRVNMTLYRQKVYKDYQIPSERLQQWKKLLSGSEGAGKNGGKMRTDFYPRRTNDFPRPPSMAGPPRPALGDIKAISDGGVKKRPWTANATACPVRRHGIITHTRAT
ncbi:MAG: hypothetical protein ACE5GH_01105 [Fidelibacterota bacterium]